MADPKTPETPKADAKAMTAAQAAKAVGVDAKDVMAFRDYGTHVVVVTIDGRKLSNAPA